MCRALAVCPTVGVKEGRKGRRKEKRIIERMREKGKTGRQTDRQMTAHGGPSGSLFGGVGVTAIHSASPEGVAGMSTLEEELSWPAQKIH